jgi:hypothetical protein
MPPAQLKVLAKLIRRLQGNSESSFLFGGIELHQIGSFASPQQVKRQPWIIRENAIHSKVDHSL